ncbi:DUF2243 domain-containing protein [Negadavirga shengliensis]|uniref:DUF2243 domain-containing protein n=1 Tax=Negadavirga shengliensis TaxID=1389218 RepID=A0ABV9SW19_9BACT
MGLTSVLKLNCISCNRDVQEALYNTVFLPKLFTMILGFIILAFIVIILALFSFKKYKSHSAFVPDKDLLNPVPLSITAIILGIGIGGFIDGILFHQILQWHGMFTNQLPADTIVGKSVNMFWDGIFHSLTLIAVIIGIISLTRLLKKKNINPSPKLVLGGFFAGWGHFNFVEGIIHHHILNFHNIKEFSNNPNLWNYGFLIIGVIFMIIGFTIIYNREHYPARLDEE